MTLTDVLVGLAIAVGIAGVVVPVLPGSLLVLGAILVWALEVSTGTGWVVFSIAATALVVGSIVKYLVPGRRLKAAAVPNRSLVAGGLGAVVGFFVIPVVGALAGFPIGVYVAERVRLGPGAAGASTRHALRAVGVSILIELTAAVVAAAVWVVGVVLV